MADFRKVTEKFYVAPQITADDVKLAAEQGFKSLIMNRPSGETPDQPATETLVAQAKAEGLTFAHIPIQGPPEVEDVRKTLSELESAGDNKVLAFCRSGTRSITLWAFAQAASGKMDVADILQHAEAAGYNLTGMAPALEHLSTTS